MPELFEHGEFRAIVFINSTFAISLPSSFVLMNDQKGILLVFRS
jgi:hypothetical protein